MAQKLLHSNPILRLTEMTDHTPHVSDDTTPFHNTCVSEHNGENKIKIKDYGDEQPYNATRDRNSIPILHSSLNSITFDFGISAGARTKHSVQSSPIGRLCQISLRLHGVWIRPAVRQKVAKT